MLIAQHSDTRFICGLSTTFNQKTIYIASGFNEHKAALA